VSAVDGEGAASLRTVRAKRARDRKKREDGVLMAEVSGQRSWRGTRGEGWSALSQQNPSRSCPPYVAQETSYFEPDLQDVVGEGKTLSRRTINGRLFNFWSAWGTAERITSPSFIAGVRVLDQIERVFGLVVTKGSFEAHL
jgi:hypothetical protein